MTLDAQVFPRELSAISSGSRWNNTIVTLGSGAEVRNINWSDARRRFNASNPTLTLAQLRTIEKHFNARRGSGRSFPLLDRSFFQATTEPLGTAGGIASTMQLTINDGDASNAYNREIYLPKTGTIHIFANAVEKAETTDWTLAYSGATAGTLTWVTNQSGASITWTGEFYVPARYEMMEFPDSRLFLWRSDGTGLVEGPEIPLVEVRYPSEF
jgi:uncharacterized protein (TIGR02217 family)